MRQKRREAPEWIYPWKGRREPLWPKLVAVVCGVLFCAGLLGLIRIQTTTPSPWGLEKASVIHVLDTPEGRELALKARENGPSPVRFETSDWPQLVRFQDQQMTALSRSRRVYHPKLREWQEPPPEEPPIWESNTGVLPSLPEPSPLPEIPAMGAPHPTIRPISGLSEDEIPSSLPRYQGATDAAMLSGTVRFLLRLDGEGRVTECLALSGADTIEATAELATWLRSVRFPPRDDPEAWAAVSILFLNRAP